MKNKVLSILLPTLVGVGFLILLYFALQQRKRNDQYQQRLYFLCSPGVYIQTVSNNEVDYAVCLLSPYSGEFSVRKITK